MGDLKLFKINQNKVEEQESTTFKFEKSLQSLIEDNLEAIFGIRFLDREYSTGKEHGGRIDTLGIDENNCPVIIEYKRFVDENVINQGLFYLDWLMDHQDNFNLMASRKFRNEFGNEDIEKIEWSSPRLLCIANSFTKYDEHAVKQINRNIELIRYKKYKNDMLLFELVNSQSATNKVEPFIVTSSKSQTVYKTFGEYLEQASEEVKNTYRLIDEFILKLGDDIQAKELKYYKVYKVIKNFVCLEVRPQTKQVLLYLKLDPSKEDLQDGLIRDVSNIGHYGTGNLEVKISNLEDFEKTKHLVIKSYEMS